MSGPGAKPGGGRRVYLADSWEDEPATEWDAGTHYDSMPTKSDARYEDCPDVAEVMQALMAVEADELTDDHVAFAASVDPDVADALVTRSCSHERLAPLAGLLPGNVQRLLA